MTPKVSIYLDFIRLFLAACVVVGHAQGYIFPAIPKFLASHAEEAVVGFFVLSGYVIAFVTRHKEKTAAAYVQARVARIYSVVLLALAATYLADSLGRYLNPADYATISFYDPDYASSVWRALTYTNELWWKHIVFGSNEAYWSLGFEIPFYIIFGVMIYGRGRWVAWLALPLLVFYGPKLALFFTLWLIGVATFRIVDAQAVRARPILYGGLFIASIALYIADKLMFSHYKLGIFRLVELDAGEAARGFAYLLVIALSLALNIIAFSRLRFFDGIEKSRFAPAVRWLAGGSFTLYIVHQPILTLLRAAFPGIRDSIPAGLAGVLFTIAICYALAEAGERRKHLVTNVLRGLIPDWLRAAVSVAPPKLPPATPRPL